jgi:hypothetical protein
MRHKYFVTNARASILYLFVLVFFIHVLVLSSLRFSGFSKTSDKSWGRGVMTASALELRARMPSADEPKLANRSVGSASKNSQTVRKPITDTRIGLVELSSEPVGGLSAPYQFLTLDQLDQSASPVSDLGLTLGKIFPLFSGVVLVELWIDDQGRVIHVVVHQGQSLNAEPSDYEVLLKSEFKPAMKDGLPVASRKLIEIDTDQPFIF